MLIIFFLIKNVKTAVRCLYERTTKFELCRNGKAFIFKLVTKRQICFNGTKYFANTTTLFLI